jgi:hypothetical protein
MEGITPARRITRRNPTTTNMKPRQTIELGNGATYRNERYTVYEHSKYPRHSVLAGQRRRVWLDDFATLAEAQAAYPRATWSGPTYQAPYLEHLPDNEG